MVPNWNSCQYREGVHVLPEKFVEFVPITPMDVEVIDYRPFLKFEYFITHDKKRVPVSKIHKYRPIIHDSDLLRRINNISHANVSVGRGSRHYTIWLFYRNEVSAIFHNESAIIGYEANYHPDLIRTTSIIANKLGIGTSDAFKMVEKDMRGGVLDLLRLNIQPSSSLVTQNQETLVDYTNATGMELSEDRSSIVFYTSPECPPITAREVVTTLRLMHYKIIDLVIYCYGTYTIENMNKLIRKHVG